MVNPFVFCAEGLELALDGGEGLLASLAGLAAEDELGAELPALGDVPLGDDLGVDQGVVVLEVGTETLGLEGGPDGELQHGVGDLGGDIPQLLVLGAEEDDDTVGLGVEGGGDVLEGLLDDLLDLGGGDGQVLGEGVVGAAVLDVLENDAGVDGRHLG
ncbi:hypothetical protein VM1G_11752 [Cytospora mali]|uniref:Uncharacterized protein n=1 Tax=Cytospora mali TaxID=578113 RepID=A0A194W698_CYTMA|nr:hypothetical protein VM1G_11752 [Valsa mali]